MTQAAAGQFWFDAVEITSDRVYTAPAPYPNGIRLSTTLFSFGDWTSLLKFPLAMGRLDPHISAMGVLAYQPAFRPLFSVSALYSISDPNDHGSRDLFDYFDCNVNHPDWFLLDAQGQRIAKSGFPNEWLMDVGNPLVQQRAVASLRDLLSRTNNPSIFLDDVDAVIFGASGQLILPKYPSDALWWQQLTHHISALSQGIAATPGSTLIANASNGRYWVRQGLPNNQDGPGIAWLPSLGGFVQEFPFANVDGNGNTVYRPYAPSPSDAWFNDFWIDNLRAMVENPNSQQMELFNVSPSNHAASRYLIASYLLGQHAHTTLGFGGNFTLPSELSIPLGNPLGTYQIAQGDLASGGLFSRAYDKGVVFVNPMASNTFTTAAPQAGTDWDGHAIQSGDTIALPPHTGYALLYSGGSGSSSSSSTGNPSNTQVLNNDLKGTRAYPNPWRSNQDAGVSVTFDQMTLDATVKIFTLSGHWVKTLSSANGAVKWDLTNDTGEKVASGMYIYLVTNPQGQKQKGKLVVIK